MREGLVRETDKEKMLDPIRSVATVEQNRMGM
jgi:hypothetical protein